MFTRTFSTLKCVLRAYFDWLTRQPMNQPRHVVKKTQRNVEKVSLSVRLLTACVCIFKVITLVGSNQRNYFENATACSKRK